MKHHTNSGIKAGGGNPVRVLLVDDHLVVRVGLRALLEITPKIVVVGETGRGLEVPPLIANVRPDVVLLDLRLPDLDGIEVCRRIKNEVPSPVVLFLTSYADDKTVLAAIEAGADGYLLKEVAGLDIPSMILTAATGGSVLDPVVTRRALASVQKSKNFTAGHLQQDPLETLTAQERRVLELTAEGGSNKQIANSMNLSEGTVRNYLSSIFSKLQVENRVEAATYWLRRPGA
jgi:two-component system, NarL family, response regulator DevR